MKNKKPALGVTSHTKKSDDSHSKTPCSTTTLSNILQRRDIGSLVNGQEVIVLYAGVPATMLYYRKNNKTKEELQEDDTAEPYLELIEIPSITSKQFVGEETLTAKYSSFSIYKIPLHSLFHEQRIDEQAHLYPSEVQTRRRVYANYNSAREDEFNSISLLMEEYDKRNNRVSTSIPPTTRDMIRQETQPDIHPTHRKPFVYGQEPEQTDFDAALHAMIEDTAREKEGTQTPHPPDTTRRAS